MKFKGSPTSIHPSIINPSFPSDQNHPKISNHWNRTRVIRVVWRVFITAGQLN